MTSTPPDRTPSPLRPARVCFLQTLALLALGLVPVPFGWARSALESARTPGLNRADRESSSAGYYQGLIGGGDSLHGPQSELSVRIMGPPVDWVRFHAADVTFPLPDRDFLQFELKANVSKSLFGKPFTTNSHGMRDREYTVEKPPVTFRVAVLGSSIDMGWGVDVDETYVNLLEDWLNAHAEKRGVRRRYQVLNFAVAAYSPLQRLESYRRKAREFRPDLVIYSATMLDTRLMEIHLSDLFRGHADLNYDYLRAAVAQAGLTDYDTELDADDRLVHKDSFKRKLRPLYWPIYDATLGALAADCRSEGVALACMVIPRVGKADSPEARADTVARLRAIAAHHAVPMLDLSGTFDGQDPAQFEIAAWDDHPNALGHRRLFLALARALVDEPDLYQLVFPDVAGAGDE
jgi:hypothetical protein